MSPESMVFFLILFLLFYTYAGYPLLLLVWGFLFKRKRKIDEKNLPSVTLIIPAYNEEAVIEKKLKNALSLDYPAGLLDIVVASDCSSDATVQKARAFSGVRVLDYRERGGKMGTVNKAVREAKGDILVLTDANAMFAGYTIRELVKYFADPAVGCVSGAKIIRNEASAGLNTTGMGEGGYWKYESLLKYAETLSGSCVSADGSVYAVRKSAYPFPPDRRIIMDDLAVSLLVVKKGFECVFEPAARAFEESAVRIRDEFQRKARIFAGAFSLFVSCPGVLWTSVSFKLFSHKILRWSTFILQAALFYVSWRLSSDPHFRPVFGAQVVFYACALVGAVLNNAGVRLMVFHLPYYFNMTTLAQVWGLVHYLRFGSRAAWEKRR